VKVHRGFKYRIYPTAAQIELLLLWEASLRFLWNNLLGQRFERLDEYIHGRPYRSVGCIEQQAQIKPTREEDERLRSVPSDACQGVLRDLDAAWNLWEGSMALREWAHDSGFREAALENLKDERIRELWRSCGLEMTLEKIKGIWRAPGLVYMARERQRFLQSKYYRFHKMSEPVRKKDAVADTDGGGNGKRKKKRKKKSKGMPHFKRFHDSVGMLLYKRLSSRKGVSASRKTQRWG
jgi:hypothetical protein